ncbi:MAG TPA: redoxin domain-containing protein, partial [Bacteroidota bacterium]|nr:redoxin domain-containing protein [Bacteroidota bacterium]
FPLLSDVTRTVSKAYGGVYADFAGVPQYEASKRAVYVIDEKGKIIFTWVTEAPGVEPPYDEVRKAVA